MTTYESTYKSKPRSRDQKCIFMMQESSTTNANHHHHNNRNNVRKGSADPMSILKAQRDLELNCSRHHGLGFSRKSVSFCQRDNVHVYENDEAEEVTDDSAEENNDDFVDHLLTGLS